MTKKAERKRGYNQSKLLAEGIAKKTELPLYAHILQKRKDSNQQKSLTMAERKQNLKGCFHIHERKECRGKSFLLIDDVLTTGSTANEIANLLRGAGAKAVYLLTIASVQYNNKPKEKKSKWHNFFEGLQIALGWK